MDRASASIATDSVRHYQRPIKRATRPRPSGPDEEIHDEFPIAWTFQDQRAMHRGSNHLRVTPRPGTSTSKTRRLLAGVNRQERGTTPSLAGPALKDPSRLSTT